MPLTTAVNIVPWPAWIGLMAAGFALFWPLGLAILIYLVWSGKMMCCGAMARWKDDLRTALGVGRGDYGSSGNVRYILGASLAAVVIAMALIWFYYAA